MTHNILDINGESFQLFIIKCIINSPRFYRAIKSYLKADFFTSQYPQILYTVIGEFYAENNTVPQFDTMEYLVRSKLNSDTFTRDVCLKEIYKLKTQPVFKDEEFIKEKVINFCKREAAIEATRKSTKLIEFYTNEVTVEPDFTQIYEAWKDVLGIQIDTIDSDIVELFEDFYQEENIRKNVKPIGWNLLDYLYNGGLGAGDLMTIAAFSGCGKTTTCINIGAQAYMRGDTILHFTFENAKSYLARHYHACITGIPMRKLFERKELVHERLNSYTGRIHVKEYPMAKHSLSTLESYYSQLVDEGIKPGMIIIDSPLHLKPSGGRKVAERKDALGEIWKECKGWAQSIETPVITTAQLNRSASNQQVNAGDSMGDSIDIYRDSDAVLTTGRDGMDALMGRLYFHNAKNRFGPDKQTWKMNWVGGNCQITEDEESTVPMLQELLKGEAAGSAQVFSE